ncbi:DUF1217 domain-containing protein [Paracoccus aurantiacus]|uniref:DUF1217 domain-containing protein n=1 Tax=Paracoccus aurantiacus TaxID=2599412 RepID=A0A5C6S536_9RHOB|nr:DUF1217 domain-containing protein [Paracoccus aurantiacus]TXB69710.1 DUF1217 domain-containing protein [Paracoccus aurantiacus]
MTFQVLTGGGGLSGWALLNRTSARQRELVGSDGAVQSATSNFSRKIASVSTADELLSDYRLMEVALKAFGLEGDMGNKAFIRKILESDLSDEKSLANRLSNKTYRQLAETFGFGSESGAQTDTKGFAERITAQYVDREFESRVGDGDQNLRLALNARRELSGLATRQSTEDTKWYEVLGNTALRKVFEGAFGFSSAYGKLPIDRQLQEFKGAAQKMFGTSEMSAIAQPDNFEKLVQRFLVRSAIDVDSAPNRYSTALTLLSGM